MWSGTTLYTADVINITVVYVNKTDYFIRCTKVSPYHTARRNFSDNFTLSYFADINYHLISIDTKQI